jgi:hypothetical protein
MDGSHVADVLVLAGQRAVHGRTIPPAVLVHEDMRKDMNHNLQAHACYCDATQLSRMGSTRALYIARSKTK